MVEQRILTLRADGTFLEGGQLMGGLQSSDGSGMYSGDASATSRSVSDAQGRWRTGNGYISLEWNAGRTEEWEYVVSGDDMMFRSGKTRKMWLRIR